MDEQILERWVWEQDFRRTKTGCEALWKKKWRPVELLAEEQALSRGVINHRIGRIIRVFKWGVAEEIVPESVWRALTTVRGLEKGRTTVRETEPVQPVAVEVVEATLPFLLPPVRAMVELQLSTGMRPGEVCAMRACELDTTGEVWLYRPEQHKTKHRGKERVVAIGPRGQEIIRPFLKLDTQAYLFSPRDALTALRSPAFRSKTKVQPSQQCRKKRKPRKAPGEHYVTLSYLHAVAKAVARQHGRGVRRLQEDVPCGAVRRLQESGHPDLASQSNPAHPRYRGTAPLWLGSRTSGSRTFAGSSNRSVRGTRRRSCRESGERDRLKRSPRTNEHVTAQSGLPE